MSELNFNYAVLLVLAVIIIFAIYRYRGKFTIGLKAWGIGLDMKGENSSPEAAPASSNSDESSEKQTEAQKPVKHIEASGKGSVAVGSADGATIITGSNNTVTKKKDDVGKEK